MGQSKVDIFVCIGDCLREANVNDSTFPHIANEFDVKFDRCFSPGTWTLPSHTSLYTFDNPYEHEVVRRGQKLSENQSEIGETSRANGYSTAIFSENPTFSTKNGFDSGIDYVDDQINLKLFPTSFAAMNHVEEIGLSGAITIGKAIARNPSKVKNVVNTLYAGYSYQCALPTTEFAHNGDQVLSHLIYYIQKNSTPLCCFANFLDTHNPHHAPPSRGASLLGLDVPPEERRALAAVNDDRMYVLDDREAPPPETREHFQTWEEVFSRREDIYRAQVREFDALIEDLYEEVPQEQIEDALVVVTGDHGQLFGAEGMLGHQTSLHPHGVHVPLYVDLPSSWDDPERAKTIGEPVSLVDVARGIQGVMRGEISSGSEFVSELTASETVNLCVDGPTWDVETLYDHYPASAVDRLKIRKYGRVVNRNTMIVYECLWGKQSVEKLVYEYSTDIRSVVSRDSITDRDEDITEAQYQWLTSGNNESVDTETSQRLRALGYL